MATKLIFALEIVKNYCLLKFVMGINKGLLIRRSLVRAQFEEPLLKPN